MTGWKVQAYGIDYAPGIQISNIKYWFKKIPEKRGKKNILIKMENPMLFWLQSPNYPFHKICLKCHPVNFEFDPQRIFVKDSLSKKWF